MRETIEKLKESPLFNLSLSSNELFHSNFLYWIAKNYPTEFGGLFVNYLNIRPEDTNIKNIYREKRNIDLSFTYSNEQEILIENKVKSIPHKGQLGRYSKNHTQHKNYILLSLSKPIFFSSEGRMEINGAKWQYLSYVDLSNMLKALILKIENDYHRQIINDYCEFITGLIEVNGYCEGHQEEMFDFHSITENELYRELKDIRLHDFYLKKKYELLAYEVYKKLKEDRNNLTEFGQSLNWKNNTPIIFMGFGMTRSLGLMDLKYLITKDVALGIQIQGQHYRMVVEDTNGKVAKKIKNDLDNGLWFDFSQSFPAKKVYPKAEKGFNKYGQTFFYKSVKLGTQQKTKDIINTILSDVHKIESNFEDIKKVISRA